MKNKFIKTAILLGSLAVTACGPSSNSQEANTSVETSSEISNSSEQIANTLKGALKKLNTTKNYTAKIYINNTWNYSVVVNENYVGMDYVRDTDKFQFFVSDNTGIFPLNVDQGFTLAGEYRKDASDNNYTDLFNNSITKTMFGIQTDYVNSISNEATSITITDKIYKLSLLDFLGMERATFVDLESVTAEYNEGLNISLDFGKTTYVVKFVNFGTSTNATVESFLAKGGTVYTPDRYLAGMKRLVASNNYLSLIYDFDLGEDGNYRPISQVYNPHYFYTTSDGITADSGAKQGYLELKRTSPLTETQKSSPYYVNGLDEAYGVYMFVSQDNMYSISNRTVYDIPDMEYIMHYPSLLKLLNNTQYFNEGILKEFENKYQPDAEHCYVLKNVDLIKDFAANFNLNDVWSFDTCRPYALGVEINLTGRDASSSIIFHYCFTYNGTKKDYLIPLYSFGQTNNEILDGFYNLYQD